MAANIMTDLEIMSGKVFNILTNPATFCDWKKPSISEELCYCFEPRFKVRLVQYKKTTGGQPKNLYFWRQTHPHICLRYPYNFDLAIYHYKLSTTILSHSLANNTEISV